MRQNPLWDFEIQMDQLISARRPDLEKRTCRIVDCVAPADLQVKVKER